MVFQSLYRSGRSEKWYELIRRTESVQRGRQHEAVVGICTVRSVCILPRIGKYRIQAMWNKRFVKQISFFRILGPKSKWKVPILLLLKQEDAYFPSLIFHSDMGETVVLLIASNRGVVKNDMKLTNKESIIVFIS